jgi:hypothetical protein
MSTRIKLSNPLSLVCSWLLSKWSTQSRPWDILSSARTGQSQLGLPNHSMDIWIRGSMFDIWYSILSNIWRFGPFNIYDGSIFDHWMVWLIEYLNIWSSESFRYLIDRIPNRSNIELSNIEYYSNLYSTT